MPGQKPTAQEQQAREQFHQKITGGDGRAAIGAPGAQRNPGDERNVEKPGDRIAAVRTMRRWGYHAQSTRHPMDADVEKAADHRAEHKKDHGPEMERNGAPDGGIKKAGHEWRARFVVYGEAIVLRVAYCLSPIAQS